jgi:hypothetical protein
VASPFSFVLISSSLTSHFIEQQNKCKVLEIILHDLGGNHYEIIAFVYFQMFYGMAKKNVTTNTNE